MNKPDRLSGFLGFLCQYYADPAWQDIVESAIKRLTEEEVAILLQIIDDARIVTGEKLALDAKIRKYRNP
jgi:endo-alpha-1,4-polygalactosaminidase (GH114 family)